MVLAYGVERRLIGSNVAEKVKRVSKARTEMSTYTPDEVAKVLQAADGDRDGHLWYLALSGLRRGEVGGLLDGRGAAGPVPALVAAAGEGAGEDLAEHMVFRPAGRSGFSVERLGPKSFAVRGAGIERLLARYDVDNDDAMAYFEGRLRRIGVLKALEAEGFQAGDEIEIAGETFELDPE